MLNFDVELLRSPYHNLSPHESTDVPQMFKRFESGALSGKMLLIRIIGNNRIDAYFRAG